MKIKIIATMAAIVCCLNLPAQDSLKIMFLKPEPLLIGGKAYRTGDFFPASKAESLTDKQVVRVFDKISGKMRTFTKELLKESGHKNIWAYFNDGSKRLSTRGGKLLNNLELSIFFNRKIGLLERISVDAFLPVDSSRFYFVNYEYGGDNINKKLPVNNNFIIIDRSIFIIDGVRKEPFDTKLKLYYYDTEAEQSRLIADSLELKIISAKECRSFIDDYLDIGLDKSDIKELIAEYLSIYQTDIFFQLEDIELFVAELMLNKEQK